MTSSPTSRNWLSILSLGVIWGGTFMVTAIALEGHAPLTVATARTTLGAVSLCLLTVLLRRPLPARATLPFVLLGGALSTAVPFMLLSWGIQHVPSAFAGLAMALVPIFVLPLAHLFSDEPMQRRSLIGVGLGLCGAMVLFGPGLFGAGVMGAGPVVLGQLACIGAALCYAVSSVATRNCPPIDPIAFAASTLLVGTAILLPIQLATAGLPALAPGRAGLAIVFLGLFPTALAALLRVSVIRSAGSVFMTLVNYQVPLWSVFFGWLVLGERLSPGFYAALALILTGLVISQWSSITRLTATLLRR